MEEIAVEFPLKGEWTAGTTPGYKVPSHGTDLLGMTYAFDFVRLDWNRKGIHLHTKGAFQYLFGSVGLEHCPGWGQGIYTPFRGEVVEVVVRANRPLCGSSPPGESHHVARFDLSHLDRDLEDGGAARAVVVDPGAARE